MGHALSSRQVKVAWLVNHQPLWFGYPKYADTVERRVIEQMRNDGLVSPNTHLINTSDLGKLIAEARGQIEHNKHHHSKE